MGQGIDVDLEALESRLRVAFRERRLLLEALVHRSLVNESRGAGLRSNERLEFLGDAFLGLVVARELMARFPDVDEGALTEYRSALVRGETLARVAIRLGLGEFLLLGTGEEMGGGRERESILAAAFEAVTGAVYLDRGYGRAHGFAMRSLRVEIRRLVREGAPKDAKSALQEAVQAHGVGLPRYREVKGDGREPAREYAVEVMVDGEVVGQGRGQRKAEAQREAAREALAALEERWGRGAKQERPARGEG